MTSHRAARTRLVRCEACGRKLRVNMAGNLPRHMRPERALAWRVCTPSVLLTVEADNV